MNDELYRMALVGLEAERAKIQANIDEIEGLLRGQKPISLKPGRRQVVNMATLEAKPKRQMSDKERAAIAAAQRKRWKLLKKGA